MCVQHRYKQVLYSAIINNEIGKVRLFCLEIGHDWKFWNSGLNPLTTAILKANFDIVEAITPYTSIDRQVKLLVQNFTTRWIFHFLAQVVPSIKGISRAKNRQNIGGGFCFL